ncbi:unnamed protein product [Rotaria magnacalcarata]|uniref:ubiquitinyl hydrolase 1 n=1 Tax=Rotaria magnacalcarata TaxID=392030 RepID=A0A819XFM6_9BILA|nr:unnamed protein product [Rotaria magnacalcarata]CAF4135228.1 unnamed protein product [Rotaria magnacalcarata]CAF4423591.1 unnamed protein product [Rotaria magnacalcarata]
MQKKSFNYVASGSRLERVKFFDILDESDEILSHGKELNYTLEAAKPLDGDLIRWEIPFLLFRIIFCEKQIDFQPVSGISGGIPLVCFVKHEYFQLHIKPKLCQEICKILLQNFCEKQTFIKNDEGEWYGSYEELIEGKCLFKEDKIIKLLKCRSIDMLNSFLLAKGWLSHELLYHVISYHYRVEYRLSEKNDKEIAILFREKDLPTENSEFSHLDIMIGFTILSCLYRGLNLKQIKDGLIKLKMDPKRDKNMLLRTWVKENEEFPSWLNSFTTLDLENENTIEKAHIYLSRNFSFIEYYLSGIITEMTNFDVSKYLIKNIDKKFDGIVYFCDRTSKIRVILSHEQCIPLSACHIDNKKLFVYLDEVHTRGTDLKLPLTAREIVTLGKNMNKDKLMRAVMRLRDLDFKQSRVWVGCRYGCITPVDD